VQPDHVTLECVFTGREKLIEVGAVLPVTARLPNDQLLHDLKSSSLEQVTSIGDALAPATIAHATYAGRRYAEELDAPPLAIGALPFKREITELLNS
jgi:dimethylamine/trimethylamine dehydrogenase